MIKRVLINIACNSAALKKANLVKNQQSLGENRQKLSKSHQKISRCYQMLPDLGKYRLSLARKNPQLAGPDIKFYGALWQAYILTNINEIAQFGY